ncbi:Acb2/Tad1 domain-containing protein [Streptomyces sp. XC 2026]|uniref:Acb2/Tad1 domain-containing protein n=1 Tax=Streptomyces sp. XC 2026 TaxID=2782004 RepID=UPI0019060E6D|nr:hypothetical protein [Streptomyces sp. XC 2026]QQN79723.1 hypothetical protein IPZ77_21595 [Streptomyces sp. XC 2026]QQN80669.1 hypothetical protein IPZ77_27060 [Streptomyces sp. XC 2026]
MAYDLNLDNRFTYHPPHGDQAQRYERLRAAAKEYAEVLVELCPSSPELTRAVNAVDDSVMLGNAAIARHG